MNEVIDEMYKRKKLSFSKTIMQKFDIYSEHYDTIIIVEGASDEDFYKHTNIEILNNACYIYAKQIKDDLNKEKYAVGKEAVIKAYFEIKESSWRKKFNNSVIFIVDRDFFGIDWRAPKYSRIAQEKKAKPEDITNLTILNCHSHECYFFLKNNLKQIFKILNIEDKFEKFNYILKENLDDFSEYFAYKSILEDENPNLSHFWYINDNIDNIAGIDFNFEFKDGELKFNKEDMQKGIDKMKREIEFSHNKKNLENQYLEMKQKFKSQPEFLRGHTLYELLECYLRYYGKSIKNYKEYKDEIIKKMDIPLNIKVLKLGIGRYKLDVD